MAAGHRPVIVYVCIRRFSTNSRIANEPRNDTDFMCKLDCLRWHHRQYSSRQGLPKLQGVAVLQGDCGLGVYHHRHRGFDVCSIFSNGSQIKSSPCSIFQPCVQFQIGQNPNSFAICAAASIKGADRAEYTAAAPWHRDAFVT